MDPFAAPSTAGGSSGPSSLTMSSDSVFNAPVGRVCPATGRASGHDGTQQQGQTTGQDLALHGRASGHDSGKRSDELIRQMQTTVQTQVEVYRPVKAPGAPPPQPQITPVIWRLASESHLAN